MENLQKLGGGVEVCAAADVSEATLRQAKEQFKIPRVYGDYREMLKKETDLDAIDVCTPNSLHAPSTIAAFEASRHVMVEKPMAMNAKEAQAMLDASKRADKQLVIGFQFRFDARTKVIRDQVDRG